MPLSRSLANVLSLGDLPNRNLDLSSRKPPVFHIPLDDDDDDHSSSLDEHLPFPRSTSPPSSSSCSRPQLPRGVSTPVFLSNGKPLKSSLKSSSSSPTIVTPPQPQHIHSRARSEPSTPVVAHRHVRFPEKDYALATVRVFNRSARPAALSNPASDETETDGDETPPTRFPFPPLSPVFNYEIDPTQSSPVPSQLSPPANLVLESLLLSPPSSLSPTLPTKSLLTGSILVRNLAFEKHIAIRFTLDDWQTISEVGAHFLESLAPRPPQMLPPPPVSTSGVTGPQGRGWDRFTFTIRLEDYAHSLSTRTLWLAARYRINSTYPDPDSTQYGPGGEWWDNNGGTNYRLGFRPAVTPPPSSRNRSRRQTVSAPIASPRTQPQPATTCKEHAFGFMVPSVPNNKETQPANGTDRHSTPLRAGKLSLCNYVPPTVRTTSSVSIPCAGSPQGLSPSLITNSELCSITMHLSSDEDTASPASSTLSTPSVSPTMVPRVIISGQPATFTQPQGSSQGEDSCRPGYITDWDWSTPRKQRIASPPRQCTDLVPVSGLPPQPPGETARVKSNSLYDAFVTQWCFAQGSSPNHHGYDGGGIMA